MEELLTLKELGSRLQGHPAMHVTPGIEACTGALGEGLSYANGIALAARLQGPRTASTACWAMARCTKARCGKLP